MEAQLVTGAIQDTRILTASAPDATAAESHKATQNKAGRNLSRHMT
jgi:hypothetical protein